jgi:hypothetical protein
MDTLGALPDEPITRERRISLELKYAAIAIAVLGALVVVHWVDALSGVNNTLSSSVNTAASFGAVGVFVIALVSNATVIIQIPYTLPLLSAALGGADLEHMLLLGVASGIGAGIGAIMGYHVAERIVGKHPVLPDTRMFRWVSRNVEGRPRATRWMIFALALSPLPDGTIVLPMAVVRYGSRRISWPLFLGKFLHNVLTALVFYAFGSWAQHHISTKASTDLALVVAALFVVLVCYHAEKANRLRRAAATGPDARGAAAAATGAGSGPSALDGDADGASTAPTA